MKILMVSNRDVFNGNIAGLEAYPIQGPEELDEAVLTVANGLVVDAHDLRYAHGIVSAIRTSPNEQIFLKPLFLFTTDEIDDPFLSTLPDDTTDLQSLVLILDRIGKIQTRIDQLAFHEAQSLKHNMTIRLLRMLFTRNTTFKPVLSARARDGYILPWLAVYFKPGEERESHLIVDFARKEGLIDGEFLDRAYLCPKCEGAYVLTRECCVRCLSANLDPRDMIHHFLCAYIGPIDDFMQENTMVCPKCSEVVRHIGVDYDKPSQIYSCMSCNHESQDVTIRTVCVHCGNNCRVEELTPRMMTTLQLTSKGEQIAIQGFATTIKELLRLEGVVEYDVFRVMLSYEVPRVERSGRVSSLGFIRFQEFEAMATALQSNRADVFNELAVIIKSNLRTSDIISFYNESTLVFLFTETPQEGAHIIMGRIHDLMLALIKDNAKNYTPEIIMNYLTLDQGLDSEAYLSLMFEGRA